MYLCKLLASFGKLFICIICGLPYIISVLDSLLPGVLWCMKSAWRLSVLRFLLSTLGRGHLSAPSGCCWPKDPEPGGVG